jgi:branched-chain amino acid transport system substrate-binding protein
MTGGGDVYGPQQARGAELAVAQINAAGGVNGAPIRLQVVNDESSPAAGRTAMTTLINKYHVLAIMGPTLSDVAVKADPVADNLHTPVLAVSNTAPGIVGKCAYPCTWIWRDSLGESVAVPDAISYDLSTTHQSSAVTIHPTGDLLGTAEAQIADSTFRAYGIPVTMNIAIPDSTSGISSLVSEAISARPGIIFIGGSYGGVVAAVVHDLMKQGFTGQIVGGNTVNSQSTLNLIGTAGSGTLSGAAWWAGNDFPANSTFETAYYQAFGIAPDQFSAQAYTGILILAQAMRHAGLGKSAKYSPTEQRSMIQHALKTVALITPLGPFRFTKSHDVSQIAWILKISAVGTHELASFCNPEC